MAQGSNPCGGTNPIMETVDEAIQSAHHWLHRTAAKGTRAGASILLCLKSGQKLFQLLRVAYLSPRYSGVPRNVDYQECIDQGFEVGNIKSAFEIFYRLGRFDESKRGRFFPYFWAGSNSLHQAVVAI
jgi:hypothetical protein